MIYSDTTKCRFCSAPVDSALATAAADNRERVNSAVNQVKWIRNMAGVMWGFLPLSAIFTVGRLAVFALFFAIPISLIYWRIRYGRLMTADPDYEKAKRDGLIALLLWLLGSLMEAIFVTVM